MGDKWDEEMEKVNANLSSLKAKLKREKQSLFKVKIFIAGLILGNLVALGFQFFAV